MKKTVDIRVSRTLDMLTRALEQLLEEKRLEDISVAEICRVSTVRRGTFYRHFADKYQFFSYYLATLADKFMQSTGQSEELSELAAYAAHMHRSLLAFTQHHERLVRNSLGQTTLLEVMDLIVRQLAAGIIQRIEETPDYRNGRIVASSELIGTFYAGGLLQTLRWWISENEPMSAEDLERQSTGFLLNGLMLVNR
jgi:AcrR family transcriptional regulator